MQEVFVRVLRSRSRLTGDYPVRLLFRIATNVCLNRLEARSRAPLTGQDEALDRIASADDTEGRATARLFLESLFGREKESTRTIAVLHYVDGMTLEETAERVGLSVSGVRKRLRRLQERARLFEEREPRPGEGAE
jgi:RNA polymerase sigma-70 factor (ECF subfamily)